MEKNKFLELLNQIENLHTKNQNGSDYDFWISFYDAFKQMVSEDNNLTEEEENLFYELESVLDEADEFYLAKDKNLCRIPDSIVSELKKLNTKI